MNPSKPYTSKEIASVVERWQPCELFEMKTQNSILTISHYELYASHSHTSCRPQALEKIKAALLAVYEAGVREVGLVCAPAVQEQIVFAALSIVNDDTWLIYPHTEYPYERNLQEIKQKIWNETVIIEKTKAMHTEMEEEFAANLGFTDEVFEALEKYRHIKNVQDLPPELRTLFRDGKTETE